MANLGTGSWRTGLVVVAVVGACVASLVTLRAQAAPAGAGRTAPAPAVSPPAVPAAAGPRPLTGSASAVIAATNAHCGQVLTASLTLNGDLICVTSAGLTVAGNNVVLNLNGHFVYGSGATSSVGVRVLGNSDTVENGLVSAWDIGVQVANEKGQPSHASILRVRAAFNLSAGIQDSGSLTKITNCWVSANGLGYSETNPAYGILVTGASGGVYQGDREVNNTGAGVYAPDSNSMTITGNFADSNAGYGMLLYSGYPGGITLTGNVANYNGSDGIYAYAANVTDGGGNSARGNNYGATPSPNPPEQCFGVAC